MFQDFKSTFAEVDAICAEVGSRTCAKHVFHPNEQSKTVPINITNDDVAEGDEFFVIELCKLEEKNRKLYFGSSNQATVTIRDDDSKPLIVRDMCRVQFGDFVFSSFASSCSDFFYSTTLS